MNPDLPTEGDLLAQYRSEDQNEREIALVALEKEIYNYLRNRKVKLLEHDLNNAVQHTIERMLSAPPTVANWGELIEKANELSELVVAEEIEWLKGLPDLLNETTRLLRVNFGKMAEEDLASIANKAFMKVREKYPKLIKDSKALKNTLFEIARNIAKDEIKARKRGKRDEDNLQHFEDMAVSHGDASDDDGPKFEPSDRERNPEEHLLAKEKKHTLWQAISKMPKKHAQIFLDLHWHHLKHHEVAKKYGLKIGSIGVYNKRATEMLGVLLAGMVGLFAMFVSLFSGQSVGRYRIQLAEIDTRFEVMRGTANTNQIDPRLIQKLQSIFGTNSAYLPLIPDDLAAWTNNWGHIEEKQFKLVYDVAKKTATVFSNKDGRAIQVMSIHIESESELQAALPKIKEIIEKYLKHPNSVTK